MAINELVTVEYIKPFLPKNASQIQDAAMVIDQTRRAILISGSQRNCHISLSDWQTIADIIPNADVQPCYYGAFQLLQNNPCNGHAFDVLFALATKAVMRGIRVVQDLAYEPYPVSFSADEEDMMLKAGFAAFNHLLYNPQLQDQKFWGIDLNCRAMIATKDMGKCIIANKLGMSVYQFEKDTDPYRGIFPQLSFFH